jgi:hypothetical protein
LSRRVIRPLRTRGDRAGDTEDVVPTGADPASDEEPALARTLAALVPQRLACGARAGPQGRRIGSGCGDAGARPPLTGTRCASVNGLSLPATPAMPAHRRDPRARRLRSTARGAVALERRAVTAALAWACSSPSRALRAAVRPRRSVFLRWVPRLSVSVHPVIRVQRPRPLAADDALPAPSAICDHSPQTNDLTSGRFACYKVVWSRPGALAPRRVSWHADAAASLPPQATRRRRGGRKGALEFLSACGTAEACNVAIRQRVRRSSGLREA